MGDLLDRRVAGPLRAARVGAADSGDRVAGFLQSAGRSGKPGQPLTAGMTVEPYVSITLSCASCMS